MNKSRFVLTMALAGAAFAATAANPKIYVHPEVTTHIVMPEAISMVDISTEKVVGNQCTDNIVRIKPRMDEDGKYADYQVSEHMGTITIIGERHLAQMDLVYVLNPEDAQSFYEVGYDSTKQYNNPEVVMPREEMARYAWAVAGERRHYNNIKSNANGIHARINNIYAVGDYFFLDYTLDNKTSIPYDIDEVRVKLSDKKELKGTNVQTVELNPVFSLNNAKKFKKKLRNVLVLDKLTFPEDKVLMIEISEKQISGRVVALEIQYEDILNADGFNMTRVNEIRRAGKTIVKEVVVEKETPSNMVEYGEYNKVCQERQTYADEVKALQEEIVELQQEVNRVSGNFVALQGAYDALSKSMLQISAGKTDSSAGKNNNKGKK